MIAKQGAQLLEAPAGTSGNDEQRKGSPEDPDRFFGSGLEARKSRAIDMHENSSLDVEAMKRLTASTIPPNER